MSLRVAYLGPAGTFSEDALRGAATGGDVEAIATATVHEAIEAVASERADRALVPFENAIEGSVRPTLDALAFDVSGVTIAGEHDHPIHHALIAREQLEPVEIEAVVSHPQPLAQCARFLRRELREAELRVAASTAEAVRQVAESDRPTAALAAASAAELYGCVVMREEVEDEPGNVTRFVWIAPEDVRAEGDGAWRTTLIFSELGADHPGALVDALTEFSDRDVNLVRIESRPLRRGLGRYMFFIDLDGGEREPQVAEAVAALRGKAENVRVLGSYPLQPGRLP